MSQLFRVEQSERTSDDYLTPRWVFDTLGLTFDLDVAAPPWETHVPARRKFTKADDGLSQPWEGRVWMNPPYSNAAPWARKFIEHGYGICLLPYGRSNWLNEIWDQAEGICLPPRTGSWEFAEGLHITFAVFLAAFGDECVEAIGRLGRVR